MTTRRDRGHTPRRRRAQRSDLDRRNRIVRPARGQRRHDPPNRQRVGISQPSIYAHFASVQEIREEVSSRAFALLENRAATIVFMLEHPKTGQSAVRDMQDFIALDHPGPRAYGHFRRIMARVRPDLTPPR